MSRTEETDKAGRNICEKQHTNRVQEEKGRSREVCVFCGAEGPWWLTKQINGEFGYDLFVYEREDKKETVIRWGELKENEARIPEWALVKLLTMRLRRMTLKDLLAAHEGD